MYYYQPLNTGTPGHLYLKQNIKTHRWVSFGENPKVSPYSTCLSEVFEGPWDMCLCVSMGAVCLCEGMCLWGCCMWGAGVARGLCDTVWACLRRHMPPFYLFYFSHYLPSAFLVYFVLSSPPLPWPASSSVSASASPSILHSNNNSTGEQTWAFPLRGSGNYWYLVQKLKRSSKSKQRKTLNLKGSSGKAWIKGATLIRKM